MLGANDGIVSVAALVVGVAGASESKTALFTAGLAGLLGGALSMGVGEYVSVSTQRDAERSLLARERQELATEPETELQELAMLQQARGLPEDLSYQVAEHLTKYDALGAHAQAELNIDPEELVNPWVASGASVLSFAVGALLPLLAIVLPPPGWRVGVTFVSVLLALVLTGSLSARLGGSPVGRAVVRVVVGGALAMAITYAVGKLVGTTL